MKRAFLIRDIDSETWKDFKAACAHYDISIRATFIKHIQNIVNDYRLNGRGLGKSKTYKYKKGK